MGCRIQALFSRFPTPIQKPEKRVLQPDPIPVRRPNTDGKRAQPPTNRLVFPRLSLTKCLFGLRLFCFLPAAFSPPPSRENPYVCSLLLDKTTPTTITILWGLQELFQHALGLLLGLGFRASFPTLGLYKNMISQRKLISLKQCWEGGFQWSAPPAFLVYPMHHPAITGLQKVFARRK